MLVRRLAVLAVALTIAAAAAAPVPAATVLRVNIWPSPRHNLVAEVLVPWTELVTAATEGRVTFEMPVAPLARGKGIYDAVAGGVADVSYAIHGYTPARFPLTLVAEFPFSSDSATALSVAYWRTHKKFLEPAGEHKGVELLGLFTHGPGHIFMRDRAIHRIADLKGVKMRVGGGMQRLIAKALGVAIVAAEAPRNYEILSRGTADGTFLPPESMFKYNLLGFIHHHTRIPGGLYNTSFMLIMNKARWEALSERDKTAIRSVSGETLARLAGASWDRLDAAGRAGLEEAGIEVVEASPELIAEIRERTDPIVEEWIAEVRRKRGVDGAAVLEMLRSEVRAVTAELEAGE